MKQILGIFIFFLFLVNDIYTQNIIPNSGFEAVRECPNSQSTFEEKIPVDWFQTFEHNSPDIYNSCGIPGNFGVPYNCMGYQPAAGGRGYVGIWAYIPSMQYREFFACMLMQPLVKGKKYKISFQVAMADISRYYLDHLDFAFTSWYPYRQTQAEYMLTPAHQFVTERTLNDTAQWQIVSAEYIADGTETYLIIGYFDWTLKGTNNVGYDPPKHKWRGAYYYFDEGKLAEVLPDSVKTEEPRVDSLSMVRQQMAEEFADAWTTGFVLRGVFFDIDKYTIKPESYIQLDSVVLFMNLFPEAKIEISGHTDSTASEEHNKVLSQNRAEEVKRYLISKGISESRMIARGYASTRPRDTNKTVEGRSHNRRVEFVVLKE